MLPVHDGPLNCRRLHHVLRYMGRAQIGTVRLGLQFGLHIDSYVFVRTKSTGAIQLGGLLQRWSPTFLQKDAF